MGKPIAFGFTIVTILFVSANVGEGLPVSKLLKTRNLTDSESLKTHQILQKLDNKKQVTKLDDAALLGETIGSNCRIVNRSKRYVIKGSHWPVKNLTYKIINYPKRLKKSAVDEEISRAFRIWSEYIPLNFTAKSNGSVDIDISFDDTENGDPFDGPGKVVARSYFPISGGDVYFDIAENWTIGKRRGINLFQAATHEIGHSLGLSHSKNKSAIMAPMYRGFDPKFKLNEDDILGIQELYGKKNKSS